jgi:ferredoxin
MRGRRRILQLAFLLLVVAGVFVLGGNAERWCPFGGIEAAWGYLREGNMLCSLGVSNFYILAAVLLSVLLLRRAFCSYACPIGTVSELVQRGALRCGISPLRVPSGLDRALRLLKYPVLALILFLTWRAAELVFRGFDPCYALISRHGEDITFWTYFTAGALLLASVFVSLPFCRWLCPLAAVFHPFSRWALVRIRRDEDLCSHCEECSDACPMEIPVCELEEVTLARCTSCMSCVEACPTRPDAALDWGPRGRVRSSWSQGLLIALLLATLASGVAASYAWPAPSFVRERGEAPESVASVQLEISELTCRGRGTLLWYYLERDDLFALDGYLRLAAWPGPGLAAVQVSFDAQRTSALAVKQAITEPYFDATGGLWRSPPFEIDGYDPFAALEAPPGTPD